MKLFTIFVLCSVAVAVKAGLTKEEKKAIFRPIADGCAAETGASEADIETLTKHKPATNMETKCLRACVMKKLDMMNDNGEFSKDKALKLCDLYISGDPEKMKIAEEVIGHCIAVERPDDLCMAAEQYEMCLVEGAKKHGVDPNH